MAKDVLYEVRSCKELGRYLVAARDIQPREIIIREDPLISGPTDRGPKEIPVCLGCCGVMFENPINRCSICHWPVCSVDCQELPSHASNECQIFHKNHTRYPPPFGWPYISKSILILRCLLLKTKNPSNWDLLMNMSDNGDVRKGKPNCISSDKKILQNFAKFMPPHDSGDGSSSPEIQGDSATNEEGFLEKEVIQISGIIDTNAHAFPLSINGRSTFVCNLYSQTSLLAHKCLPNAAWSPDKSFSKLTLTIRANVPIAKGDMISVAYDDGQLLVCTLKRLVPNEINGMFICKCERCLDPTELGTYIGALKCPSCSNGYLLPVDPVDSFSSWKCDNGNSNWRRNNETRDNENGKSITSNGSLVGADAKLPLLPCLNSDDVDANTPSRKANTGDDGRGEKENGNCNEVLDDESVMEMIEEAESLCGYTKLNLGGTTGQPPPQNSEELGQDESLELLKEFAMEYSGNILHPNHYILHEVNVRILKGDYAKGLSSLSDSDLIQHLRRCERLLEIANVLTPGFCEYRAFLQFHFSQGLLCLERRKAKSKRQQLSSGNTSKGSSVDDVVHHDDDDEDVANKLKQESRDDNDGDQNGNEIISRKKEKEEGYAKYENSQSNLESLMEMLTFLLAFFRELNPEHRLLEPIGDTLEDTEKELKKLNKRKGTK